ncbi:hypothetical protein KDA14_04080 [Candidatus Saccharibacteria bacterium]|nr:hypothetical protein [Candidatus Saccharibacteria bacterium]
MPRNPGNIELFDVRMNPTCKRQAACEPRHAEALRFETIAALAEFEDMTGANTALSGLIIASEAVCDPCCYGQFSTQIDPESPHLTVTIQPASNYGKF